MPFSIRLRNFTALHSLSFIRQTYPRTDINVWKSSAWCQQRRFCLTKDTPIYASGIGRLLLLSFHRFTIHKQVTLLDSIDLNSFVNYAQKELQIKNILPILRSDPNYRFSEDGKYLRLAANLIAEPFYAQMELIATNHVSNDGMNEDRISELLNRFIPEFSPHLLNVPNLTDALRRYPTVWYQDASGTFFHVSKKLYVIARKVFHDNDSKEEKTVVERTRFEDEVERMLPGWLARMKNANGIILDEFLLRLSFLAVTNREVYFISWIKIFSKIHDEMDSTGVNKAGFFQLLQAAFPSFSTEMLRGFTLREFLLMEIGQRYFIIQDEENSLDFHVQKKDLGQQVSFEKDVLNVLPSICHRNNLSKDSWIDFETILPELCENAIKIGPQQYGRDRWIDLIKECTSLEYTVKVLVKERECVFSSVALFVDGSGLSPSNVVKVLRKLGASVNAIQHTCVVRREIDEPHTKSDVLSVPCIETYMTLEAHAAQFLSDENSSRVTSVLFICSDQMKESYLRIAGAMVGIAKHVEHIFVGTQSEIIAVQEGGKWCEK